MANATALPQLNVNLTANFRLTADDRQYIVERRAIIDPTRSPAFDPAKHDGSIREEWRREDGYFTLNSAGLAAAIDYVAIREANGWAAEVKAESLREYIDIVRRVSEGITAQINAAFRRPETVDLAAEIRG